MAASIEVDFTEEAWARLERNWAAYVSPRGARTIVEELGGRGFALYIAGIPSRHEAQDLLRTLGAFDANSEVRKGRDPS